MKIVAPPILPTHTVTPIRAVTPAARAIPGTLSSEKGTSSQQVSRFAAALVRNSRILRQRELIASRNALQSRAVKLGELYQLLMSANDTGLDNAARLLRKKLLQENDTELEQVLEFADGDAAKAHVVLQAARKQAEEDGAEGEYVALTQTLKQLRRKFGPHARAGINTARAFGRQNVDNKRRAALRNLYGVAVSGQPNVTGLIEALINEQEETGDFDLNLRDMRRAIADDLSAITPSASHEQLRTLMHGLTTARHVTTLLRGCEHLLGRMRNKNPDLKVDPPAFLKHLLTLTANGMNVNQTLQLTQHIGGARLKNQLAFLNGLRPMLMQLPILLWKDMKSRQAALNNLLTLMAELTQQEQKQLFEGLAG
ncbi:type III secretion protein HrpJ [Pseudomonas amygdali pv. tabaci str. ATCC 11528]|uniref:HrpJ n=5 Tax=Pseudomonas TaxID=286 RepID=C5IJH0_PSEAJ|nr:MULTISPECIES: type III secretion system gatekeeper subunit SctW [Pseudomonas syringae group genomosp. 2]KPX72670.1 Type III secretion component protein HrcJ [Pseudomonas amygdali pv. lachrymans]ACR46706.1 HrpJ [Pseudomonas amygdali pv. tabaci]KEZ25460.1 type III secretion protein HrpJ [Pseudomonas amygdali pv. tabaci str. 6605]KEZ64177.1 type III secretion protein HrpJ [Pseudomonas amygdali pv. tabaci str. ATCC 11528]KIY17143.1 type III secretion protein HrpJ [Pseudomonas amygdali pv. tabac